MTTRIFIDTLFVVALVNRRDHYHAQAVAVADRYEGHSTVITDAVLLEVGNALARHSKAHATAVIEHFLTSNEVETVHLTPTLFAEGLSLYRQYTDKTWGLVDCISFTVMRQMGIQAALTFDRHFVQAGFHALMIEEYSS